MKTDKKHGVALVVVLCFILVLSILATAASRLVGTQINIAGRQIDSEKAFYIAESGTERGMSLVANRQSLPKAFAENIGDGRCFVTITTKTTVGNDSGPSINGIIHLGAGGGGLVSLTTPSTTITGGNLTGSYGGYVGPATKLIVKPDGNDSQTGITVDGNVLPLEAGKQYTINSTSMQVALFNDRLSSSGKAIGEWHISVAATDANITP